MQAKYVNVLVASFIMMVGVAALCARLAVAELTTMKVLTESSNFSFFRYLPGGAKANIGADIATVSDSLHQIAHILHWLGNGSLALGAFWLVLFCVVRKFKT